MIFLCALSLLNNKKILMVDRKSVFWMKYPFPGTEPSTPIFFRYLYPFSAVSREISSSKLSSLIEGIRSFFLILPFSIAFRMEFVSCRYLGVAAYSSTRMYSKMLGCFMQTRKLLVFPHVYAAVRPYD